MRGHNSTSLANEKTKKKNWKYLDIGDKKYITSITKKTTLLKSISKILDSVILFCRV